MSKPSDGFEKNELCPNCKATIPVYKGFVKWCSKCNWNLNPLAEDKKKNNIFEQYYLSIGEQFSQTLNEDLISCSPDSLKPSWNRSKCIAFILSAIIHSFTLFFLMTGMYLLLTGWANIFRLFLSLLCLGIFWVIHPRISKFPKEVIPRSKIPTLYELTDVISRSLGAKICDGIVLNNDFNASFSQVGHNNEIIISIGLPLWCILTPEEKIALLSHEVSHGVNGDPKRSFFIGTAIDAMLKWHLLFYPEEIWGSQYGILSVLPNLIMLGLSSLANLGAIGLAQFLWMDSQRAEYLADYLATTNSGTEAMISALEKLPYASYLEFIVQSVALNKETQTKNFFSEFQNFVNEIPSSEIERVKKPPPEEVALE